MNVRIVRVSAVSLVAFAFAFALAVGACGNERGAFETQPTVFEPALEDDAGACPYQCSLDGRAVVRSCTGEVVEQCRPELACGAARCQEPCAAAAADESSNGCEFYFQQPAQIRRPACLATFVVNTSNKAVELALELESAQVDISKSLFRTAPGSAALIEHTGPIAPGESVVLFVSDADPDGPQGVHPCPRDVVPAVPVRQWLATSGIASSFRIAASAPVSVVAMYPFGGAPSALPTATLLLPVANWRKQHILINGWEASSAGSPMAQVVASEDDTEVTILPTRDIQDAPDFKGTAAMAPVSYRIDKGQHLQLVQYQELTGSVVSSNKPTTVFGGHTCAFVPVESGYCDVLFQQIPSFEQWGNEYVGVGYRPRVGDEHELMPYRIVAARDGTRLDYDPAIPPGAPVEMSAGQVVSFPAGTGDAFVVRTQDADHPIYVAAYMKSMGANYFGSPPTSPWGDPEFVNVIPAGQYLNSYTFYADPSFSETSLVIVRAKSHGEFKDVWLECAGNLTDFRRVGTRGDYEFTRVDLTKGFKPGQKFGEKVCQSGLQRMTSEGPFTATLWGWGAVASYAYPGGMANRKLVTTPLDPVR